MPKEHRPSATHPLRGKVIAFNISPRGYFEGALVETEEGIAQLNFGKHEEERLGRELVPQTRSSSRVLVEAPGWRGARRERALARNRRVTKPAGMDRPETCTNFGRAVLELGGQLDLDVELASEDGDHPVYRAASHDSEVSGTIARFNYALHGELNGYQLDNGTLVHVKPDAAKRHALKVGQEIKARGVRRVGTSAIVLEARDIQKVSRGPSAVA